jgi:hypothetical protein
MLTLDDVREFGPGTDDIMGKGQNRIGFNMGGGAVGQAATE